MKKGVALAYKGSAPEVVAKAQGELLDILLKIAKKNSVAIYRDTNLVELLYSLKQGHQIPEELYMAVARIFAYCYEVNSDFKDKFDTMVKDRDSNEEDTG